VVVKLDERKQRGLRVGLDGNAVDAPKLGTAKNVQQVKKKKEADRRTDKIPRFRQLTSPAPAIKTGQQLTL